MDAAHAYGNHERIAQALQWCPLKEIIDNRNMIIDAAHYIYIGMRMIVIKSVKITKYIMKIHGIVH